MKIVKEETGGPVKGPAKEKGARDERYAYTKEAGIEREGMARSERSALPKTGMGENPEAGYWDDMKPEDSTDMAQNKSRFGVFEKEGGSGPTVIKPGRDFSKGGDPRALNQSGVYAEKDAKVWKEMAKSAGGEDAEWCGTPADDTCDSGGAPTAASKQAAEKAGEGDDESGPAGKQGQHWSGEPWAKNPKVGGKEGEAGPSGQHWRGDEPPPERKSGAGKESEAPPPASDRPDEC